MHVTGDQFIRTLAAYMRSHESTWSHHPTTKTTTTAAPSSTTGLFVSWLGYNNNSDGNNNHNNSSSSNSNHNNHKPFIVDPWHLFYLNTRFEELDLSLLECEDDIIESIVEARGQMTRPTTMNHQSNTTNTTSAAVASLQRAVRPPSMVSVASQRSVTSTAMTLFTGFTRWSTTGSNSQKANEAPHTTVEEDVRFIHQCMQRIAAVRIGPFGKRRILDADDGTDRPNGIQVSLGAFSNVRQLEVIKISPLALTGWMRLQSQLERVGCRGRLVRVEDLLLKTLQLEMQQRILTERLTTSSDDKRDESTLKSDDDDQQQQQQQQLLHSTELLEELEALCQLSPLEVWPRLVALDLTGNSLTDIPDHPFIYVRHCMELNLSRNILTSIPRSLKDLAQLRSLDVSYNKIDSLTGIGELLPTLVQLSLASNRLRSIIGLEQLSRLERLDLSHNQIEDPQEMNRLSGLLHLSHLQVEGNPLVNISQYRITIFSLLYEGAQLYLDNAPPSFMERRQIKNRPIDAMEAIPAAVVSTQINHSSSRTAASPKPKSRRKPTRLVALSQQEFASRRESGETKGLNILGSPIRPRSDSLDTLNSEWRQSRELTSTSLTLDDGRWESLEPNRLSSTSTTNTEWSHNHSKSNPSNDDHSDMQVTAMSDSMLMVGHPTKLASKATDTIANIPNEHNHRNGVPSSRRVHRVIGLEASVSEGLANRTNGDTSNSRTRQRRATTDNITAVLSSGSSPTMNQRQTSQPRSFGLSSSPVDRPGDEFRRRIEAMRNEAGSTWLRVYNELQYRDRSSISPNAKRRESTDPHTTNVNNNNTGRDDHFSIGSSVTSKPMITLAAIRASRLQQQQQQQQTQTHDTNQHVPLNQTEIRERRLSKDDLQLADSLVSDTLLSTDSTDMKRSFSDSHRPKLVATLSAVATTESTSNPANNHKSPPTSSSSPLLALNTPTIIAQVQETTAKLHRRAARTPFETRQLIIEHHRNNDEEQGQQAILMELSLDTQQIMTHRSLNTLIYVTRVGIDRTGAALLQLRFKSSRHDPVLTVCYRIQDVKAADQLMTLFDTTRKTNWEQGHVHRVCRQSKCLSCQWMGIHQHELTGTASQSMDLTANDADNTKRLSGVVEDKQCPQCQSNFLVDFFDHSTSTDSKSKKSITTSKDTNISDHENDIITSTNTNTASATNDTASSNLENITTTNTTTGTNDSGLLSTWMSSVSPSRSKMGMLLGLGNNTSGPHEFESTKNDASSTSSSTTSRLSGWSRVAGRIAEVVTVPHENPFTSLLGYQPVLPPYQTNTNSLRLHFHLSVFEDDNENLLAWVPCSFIIQAPSKVITTSSTSARWTRIRAGESTHNVPNHCPVERPIYLALSTRAFYLVELTRPLTGGVAVVAAAASIYNPFSWQRDTTVSPQNNGSPKLAPNSLGVTNKVAESRPEQYLRILRKLTLDRLARIDVGPRNQFMTFHLQWTTTNNAIDVHSSLEDQRSITLFIRDTERCTEVLDLLEHKMEWPSNTTSTTIATSYAQLIRRDTRLWRDCLTRTTWTSSESTGLTVAIEENTITALPDPIWLTAWVCPDDKCIRSCTLSATLQNLHITTERFDVWPPSVDDVHAILDNYHDTPTQGDVMAAVVPRYQSIRKIPLLTMTKLAYARVGWSAALVDEQAHEGYTAASWSCSVRIDFRLDTEEEMATTESNQRQRHWIFLFYTRDEATHCVETLNRLYQIAQQQQQQQQQQQLVASSSSSSEQTFSGSVETLVVEEEDPSIDVKQGNNISTSSPNSMGLIDIQRVSSIQEAIEPEDV